jgi:hypothetical protein
MMNEQAKLVRHEVMEAHQAEYHNKVSDHQYAQHLTQ